MSVVSLGNIVSDTKTAVSVAPPVSPLRQSARKNLDRSYTHRCGHQDAKRVLSFMPQSKTHLIRKAEPAGDRHMYKVTSRDTHRDEVYEENMLLSMLRHHTPAFVSKADTIGLFHQVRTPPALLHRLAAGGGGQASDHPASVFLHPAGTPDEEVKRRIQEHFSRSQGQADLHQRNHVLLRIRDSPDSEHTDQVVDAFYTHSVANSNETPDFQIYSKTMPLCKAAARFMDAVVVPSSFPTGDDSLDLAGGGGASSDDDDDDSRLQVGDDDDDNDDTGSRNPGGQKGSAGSRILKDLGQMSGDQAFALGSELLQKERQKMVGAQGAIDRTEQGIIDVRNQRIISDGTNAEIVSELKADDVRLRVQHEGMQEELRNLEHTYKQQKDNLTSAIKLNEKEQASVKEAIKSNKARYSDHQEFLNRREKQLLHENKDAVQRKMQALAGVTQAQGAAEHALGKEAASEQAKARYFQQEFDTRAAEAELTSPPTGYASSPANTEAIYSPAGEYYLANSPAPGTDEGGLGYVNSAGPGDSSRDYETLEAYGKNYHDAKAEELRKINEGTAHSAIAQDEEQTVNDANADVDDANTEAVDDKDDASQSSVSSASASHLAPSPGILG